MYTDGACKGNPGIGGWGVLLRYQEHEKTLYGGEPDTTNNRMELTAVIRGLQALKRSSEVHIYTDSSYVMKGMTEWMPVWIARQWKTADKSPVKNADLWQELRALNDKHQLSWFWVKGHAGDEGNERADALANMGVATVQKIPQ